MVDLSDPTKQRTPPAPNATTSGTDRQASATIIGLFSEKFRRYGFDENTVIVTMAAIMSLSQGLITISMGFMTAIFITVFILLDEIRDSIKCSKGLVIAIFICVLPAIIACIAAVYASYLGSEALWLKLNSKLGEGITNAVIWGYLCTFLSLIIIINKNERDMHNIAKLENFPLPINSEISRIQTHNFYKENCEFDVSLSVSAGNITRITTLMKYDVVNRSKSSCSYDVTYLYRMETGVVTKCIVDGEDYLKFDQDDTHDLRGICIKINIKPSSRVNVEIHCSEPFDIDYVRGQFTLGTITPLNGMKIKVRCDDNIKFKLTPILFERKFIPSNGDNENEKIVDLGRDGILPRQGVSVSWSRKELPSSSSGGEEILEKR